MDTKFDYDTRWGFYTEMEMFKHIWNIEPHFSFISGIPIRHPSPANFAHILSKAVNRFPHYRLNPGNIVLVLPEEHNLIDQGTEKQREAYCRRIKSASFRPFYAKAERLSKEYSDHYLKNVDIDLTGTD